MWASKRPGPPAGGPQKKLVIKGLKALPILPSSYRDDTLSRLRNAVHAILENQPTTQGLEELYRDCEAMCLHKFANSIYEMLQQELKEYVHKQLSQIDKAQEALGSEEKVLEQTQQFWENYTQQLHMIRSVFLYLDRTYALHTANVASLWAMGLSVVRQYLVDSNMRTRLVRLFIGRVKNERDGQIVDEQTLASIAHMFIDLGLYTQTLLPNFIDATRDYYRRESLRLINSLVPLQQSTNADRGAQTSSAMNVPGYLAHVQHRLDEETQRAAQYLDPSIKSTLLATILSELIQKHAEKLLGSSFDAMMDANLVSDLNRLYKLVIPVDKLNALQKSWSAYIKTTGQRKMQLPDAEVTLVSGLLEFKSKLDNILNNAFQSDGKLHSALREAFEIFINTRRNKPAQLIARYVDQYMRTGSKTDDEQKMDAYLNRIIALFRFIQSKDLFEAYYRRDLSKRLLSAKSVAMDAESAFLHKLRTECGAGYTSQLEGMLRDMEVSDELATALSQATVESTISDIGFHANILTMSFWPTYEPIELALPRQVEAVQDQFAQFYAERHRGRNLQWQYNLGTCLIKVEFNEGPKELQMNQIQGTVLLLFAEQDELTYTQIQQNTGLEDSELQRTLQSLACGKFRVLTKEPKSRDVSTTDKFVFNSGFKCPQARIKISQIAVKEIEKESKEIEEHIHLDRMYRVDAALVRIMKARKTLEHDKLSSELLNQIDFNVAAAELKERIETLLERDYIRRDDSNQSTYHYIA
ncbi:hypothetical protein IWW36_003051 [Coemansia brasiliensis]|uniref:Cullin family profile domain-containing protein n=1 Tax=Coemansia brasiliensis TaxID=2650707 RepID=A0A9W8M038_9FUNG|nr:hypothetical protein IWW36_003051 [Coemansia brasiliensis]